MTRVRRHLSLALGASVLAAALGACGGGGSDDPASSTAPKPAWCDTLGFAQDLLEPHNRGLRDLVDATTWGTEYQAAGGSVALLAGADDDYQELLAYVVARYEVEAEAKGGDLPELTDEVREQASMADADHAAGACD